MSTAARRAQLQALSQRLAAQPEPVQALLRERLAQGLAELAQAPGAVTPAPGPKPAPRPRQAPAWPVIAAGGDELPSVGRFRRALSGTRARDSVARAAAQRPANAGPLNSHVLVLQAMDLMQDLSGDYLRHFVTQVESLLWLEDAAARLASAAGAKRRPKPHLSSLRKGIGAPE